MLHKHDKFMGVYSKILYPKNFPATLHTLVGGTILCAITEHTRPCQSGTHLLIVSPLESCPECYTGWGRSCGVSGRHGPAAVGSSPDWTDRRSHFSVRVQTGQCKLPLGLHKVHLFSFFLN